ncbi:phosphoribosylglycinamide formyltransferase [Saxibacter everestensis]|uniref:Phosphoribosylglycinamide formyltransferase n=1 Tax=Saxibacter everestensis TaxID=2909229 RepID=A0ABY8QR28_9MICO|nr:phosphoribosylglycinamide formyltransferase [Brevibacteriaceae bacterium ZFBP1038]
MRLVVLASGSGTLTQAMLDAADGSPFEIVAVGSDVSDAQVLTRARDAGVPTFVCTPRDFPDRTAWDAGIAAEVAAWKPDLVVSAGFMRILGAAFLEKFAGRIVNTHPALLPSFAGAHAVRDALAHGVKVTGSTIHFVDAGVDTGPIIAQRAVAVAEDDDEQSLHERIRIEERALLIQVLGRLAAGGWRIDGRRVRFTAL